MKDYYKILGLSSDATDDEIRKVAEYLHEIYNTTTPTTLHVLGRPPEDDATIAPVEDTVRIEITDTEGRSIFGAIEQAIVPLKA